jgi:hypothetical protein
LLQLHYNALFGGEFENGGIAGFGNLEEMLLNSYGVLVIGNVVGWS